MHRTYLAVRETHLEVTSQRNVHEEIQLVGMGPGPETLQVEGYDLRQPPQVQLLEGLGGAVNDRDERILGMQRTCLDCWHRGQDHPWLGPSSSFAVKAEMLSESVGESAENG